MKHLAAIILAVAASASPAQEVSSSAASLQRANVSAAYRHFDEIVNRSMQNGSASLRLIEQTVTGSQFKDRLLIPPMPLRAVRQRPAFP